MTRAASLLLVLLAVSPLAGAPEGGVIEGRVTTYGGEPFASIMVHIEDLETGFESTTTTNAAGEYRFEEVPAGTYQVTASCYRCGTMQAVDRKVGAGEVNRTDIEVPMQRFPETTGLFPCPAAGVTSLSYLEYRLELHRALGLEEMGPSELRRPGMGRLAARVLEMPYRAHERVASVYVSGETATLVAARLGEPEGNGEMVATEREVPFNGELASLLQELLWNVLPSARYLPTDRIVLHGDVYEISTVGPSRTSWCGTTETPDDASPARSLVVIGEALFDYAAAPERDRAAIKARIRDLIEQAEGYFGEGGE